MGEGRDRRIFTTSPLHALQRKATAFPRETPSTGGAVDESTTSQQPQWSSVASSDDGDVVNRVLSEAPLSGFSEDDWSTTAIGLGAIQPPSLQRAATEKATRPRACDSSAATVAVSLFNLFFVGFETLFMQQRCGTPVEQYYRSTTWFVLSSVYSSLAVYFLCEAAEFARRRGLRTYFECRGHQVQLVFLVAHILNVVLSFGCIPFLVNNANAIRASLAVCFTLRVLTAFRLMQTIGSLETTTMALTTSLRSLWWTGLFLLVLLYLSANLATRLLAGNYEDEDMQRLWGSFGQSMYTLFMVATLDGIFDFVTRTLRSHPPEQRPWIALFFAIYVTFTSILWLNIVTGVIVDNYLHADRQIRRRVENERLAEACGQTMHVLEDLFDNLKANEQEALQEAVRPALEEAKSWTPPVATGVLVLKGRSPWELLMDSHWRRAIKNAQVPEHRAYDVLTILKDFGVECITVRDFADACVVVGNGKATGRQLLVSRLQQRMHHAAVTTQASQVGGALERTRENVSKLLNDKWLGGNSPDESTLSRSANNSGNSRQRSGRIGRFGTEAPDCAPRPPVVLLTPPSSGHKPS